MDFRALNLDFRQNVASIELAGGDGNLIDQRCLNELAAACEAIAARDDVSVVTLTGRGLDFCRGWQQETRDQLLDGRPDAVIDPFAPVASLACPVIAGLQGRVASAGLELALACDIRIAASDAVFSLPEPSQGFLPLAGGTQRLPRVAGRAVALAMLLLGRELDADAALRCGLVSETAEPAALAAEISRLTGRLSSRGPLALRYAKEAVQRGLEMSLQQGLMQELDLSIILQTTADRAEGVNAFLTKRTPHFEGR